jgi:hypothetical protein
MWSTKASINDVVGGFGLMAEKDPDGATRIKFLVDADIFAVLGRNGDKRAPFVIKDGVVYMNKLLLDNAEIGSVIAKYINVQHLVGALIEGGSFRGGDLWIGENPNGQFGAYGKKWNAGIGSDGRIYGSDVYFSSGSFTGTVNANAGTFNNVTIAENCNVLGTVYAAKLVGDVTKVRAFDLGLLAGQIIPGGTAITLLSVNFDSADFTQELTIEQIDLRVWGYEQGSTTARMYVKIGSGAGVQIDVKSSSADIFSAIAPRTVNIPAGQSSLTIYYVAERKTSYNRLAQRRLIYLSKQGGSFSAS